MVNGIKNKFRRYCIRSSFLSKIPDFDHPFLSNLVWSVLRKTIFWSKTHLAPSLEQRRYQTGILSKNIHCQYDNLSGINQKLKSVWWFNKFTKQFSDYSSDLYNHIFDFRWLCYSYLKNLIVWTTKNCTRQLKCQMNSFQDTSNHSLMLNY